MGDLNETRSTSSTKDFISILKSEDKRPQGVEEANGGSVEVVLGGASEDTCMEAAHALLVGQGLVEPDEFWLRCCVRVHKNDADKAAERYQAYFRWREEFGITDGATPATIEHLQVGFMRFTGGFDVKGRPVLNVRMRFHDPKTYSATAVIRLLHFFVENMLRSYDDAMRFGICILMDASDLSMSNLDARVPKEMSRALSGHVPVRLGRVCLFKPPVSRSGNTLRYVAHCARPASLDNIQAV